MPADKLFVAAGIGPMAAVAGAVPILIGRYLLESSDEVIVENGKDTYIKKGIAGALIIIGSKMGAWVI